MPKKVGRPQKPFESSTGEIVPGLARQVDGRWRIIATGQRFSEPDEDRAIARFRTSQPRPPYVRVAVPSAGGEQTVDGNTVQTGPLMAALHRFASGLKDRADGQPVPSVKCGGDQGPAGVTLGFDLDPEIVWPWVRVQVAKMTVADLAEKLGPRFLGIRFDDGQRVERPGRRRRPVRRPHLEVGLDPAGHNRPGQRRPAIRPRPAAGGVQGRDLRFRGVQRTLRSDPASDGYDGR